MSSNLMPRLLLMMTVAFSFHVAHAGGMESGGGKGVVCRDARGKIKSVELLDLWEARNIFNRKIVRTKQPLSAQVAKSFDSLKNTLDYGWSISAGKDYSPQEWILLQLNKTADLFLKSSPDVRRLHNVTLTDTPDSYEPARPSNCQVEQIVNYQDGLHPIIVVNQDLFDKMLTTDQAALIAHEAFYAFLRTTYKEPNSIRVRRAIGYQFAGGAFTPIQNIIGHRAVNCYSDIESGTPTNGTKFTFFEVPGGLNVMEAALRNQVSVGLYPNPAKTTEWLNTIGITKLENLVTDNYCKKPKINMSIWVYGQGPVDMQRLESFTFDCTKDGHLSMYYSSMNESNPYQTTEPVKCYLNNY